jgi:hypothetical protein
MLGDNDDDDDDDIYEKERDLHMDYEDNQYLKTIRNWQVFFYRYNIK